MPLELWIILALVVIAAVAWGVLRLRRKRAAEAPEAGKNVYPLW
jgi:hypothetical protein